MILSLRLPFTKNRRYVRRHIRIRTRADSREGQMQSFDGTGLYVRPFQEDLITLKLELRDTVAYRAQIVSLLRSCEAHSRDAD